MKFRIFVSVLAISILAYSCKTASFHFNKAEKQYTQGEYAFAIENYTHALGKGADAKECNYKIAECHRRNNTLNEATPFYKAAIDAGTKHETAHLYYGMALKANGNYEEAVNVLQRYSKTGSNRKVIKRAKYEYKRINQIAKIPELRTKYKVENFEQINDAGDDYGPTFLGEKIVFASSRGESKLYAGTGYGFSDLYTFTYDDLNAKSSGFVKKLDENIINQDYTHEAEATFTPDGLIMVFARGNDGSKKGDKDVMLYKSKMMPNGDWSEPTKLEINDATAWNGCPKFSKDGKTLFFASNRKKGRGGIDLYQAEYKDGKFLHVKNMGKKINTVGNDMFPYQKDDGTFYFASDGQVGYGGLDLFMAEKDDQGRYTVDAVNLGSTINTTSDDFGINFDSKHKGFFTSNRPGGKGRDDIYKFAEVVEPYYYLKAIVRDPNEVDSLQLIDHAKLTLKSGEEMVSEDFTDKLGEFHIRLKKDKNYTLLAQKDHYFSGALEFIVNDALLATLTKTEDGDYEIPEIINLNKIVVAKEGEEKAGYKLTDFNINDIFYDLGKADIRPDAAVELDKLVGWLQENPGISVELGSHTDSRDTDANNQALSQRRADSAVAYIVNKGGIANSRIAAKGYGESKLLNRCSDGVECSEDEHQANRRTEIAVTAVENTFEKEHEEYEKTKLEEEMERLRMEELQKEMEEEERLKHEEEERKKAEEEAKKDKEQSEYQKYLEMKKKMEEMEKKFEDKKEEGTNETEGGGE